MSVSSAPFSADPSADATSAQPTANSAAWLAAAARGDGVAFDHFVAAHEAVVFRFLRSLGCESADAEDAMQETFLAAWRGAAAFRGDSSARGWLLGIARHVFHHAQRRRVGEPADFESLETIAEHAGWGTQPDDQTFEVDRQSLVHKALATLAHGDREVLVLRELQGLSGEETAAALGLSVASMKSRLHRARLRFTAALRLTLAAEDTP